MPLILLTLLCIIVHATKSIYKIDASSAASHPQTVAEVVVESDGSVYGNPNQEELVRMRKSLISYIRMVETMTLDEQRRLLIKTIPTSLAEALDQEANIVESWEDEVFR